MEKNKKSKQNGAHTLPQELIVDILLRLPHPVVLSDPLIWRLLSATSILLQCPSVFIHRNANFMVLVEGFYFFEYNARNLIVWNPSTGIHKRIPIPLIMRPLLFGFVYDASTDDYLIILMKFMPRQINYPRWQAMIKLFSLKTNSWECNYIDIRGAYIPYEGLDSRGGSFLNGALHWLVYSYNEKGGVVIAFDLVERSLSEIPLPPVLNDRQNYLLRGLRVIEGCLAVFCSSQERGKMWMMKEYKVLLLSWTMSFDFSGDRSIIFSPIFLTKNNALVGSDLHCQRLEILGGKTGQG